MDETIRNQIVIGIWREVSRRSLLSNPALTLRKAIDALMIEDQVDKETAYFRSQGEK